MTRVTHLLTRAEVWYSLPPREAVYCAAMQYPTGRVEKGLMSGGNFNTFLYAGKEAPLTTSGRVTWLNHWAALTAKE